MLRPAKILEQSWFSFKIHFGTHSVGEWRAVWKTRRDCLSFPPIPSQFVSYSLAKWSVFMIQTELEIFLRLKKKKKRKAFYRMQGIESHKWVHRASALSRTLTWTVNKYQSIVFPFLYLNWLLCLDTWWNPSEDLSTGKFSLAGSFLQICPAEGIWPKHCWLHHLFRACEFWWERSSQTQWKSSPESSSFRAIIQRQITKVWEVVERQVSKKLRGCYTEETERNCLSEIEMLRTNAILMAWNLKSWNRLRLLWCPVRMRTLQITIIKMGDRILKALWFWKDAFFTPTFHCFTSEQSSWREAGWCLQRVHRDSWGQQNGWVMSLSYYWCLPFHEKQ